MSNFIKTIQKQLDAQLPFVAYRKPNETAITAIFQDDQVIHYTTDYTETGFVFAPFDNAEKTILIPLDRKITTKEKCGTPLKSTILNKHSNSKKHIVLVEKAIQKMQTEIYDKIVLSRKISLELNQVNSIDLFQQLLNMYNSAFVYVWYHPKVGCWLGATPETLLKTRGNTFKTMSLAGTQPFQKNMTWSVKEIDEQKIVTDFIYSNLRTHVSSISLAEIVTAKAGNLAHIKTDISGVFSKNKLNKILEILHPTPAVCGVPKEDSKQFILENEGYDRQFYTGFLGELNFDTVRKSNRRNTENHAYNFATKTSNLFVNLRCMQVIKNSVHIYVGGGITVNSDPQSEYQETVNKAETMLAVFD